MKNPITKSPPAWPDAEPRQRFSHPEMEKKLPFGGPKVFMSLPLASAPDGQRVADMFKGCKHLPSSQGNIHRSNFMNLLKVLAESAL